MFFLIQFVKMRNVNNKTLPNKLIKQYVLIVILITYIKCLSQSGDKKEVFR